MATAKWMWADAGLGYNVEKMNPFRWSPSRSIKETVADLSNCKAEDKGRPVVVQISARGTKEESFDSVDSAIAGLLQVLVFTDNDGSVNTIMERHGEGLDWSVPGLGKRYVLRLHISTMTIKKVSHFVILGPFGTSIVKDPEPGPKQNNLMLRLLKLASANGVRLEGKGIHTLLESVDKTLAEASDFSMDEFVKLSGLVRKTTEPDLYTDLNLVAFKSGNSTHLIKKIDEEKMKWTRTGPGNSNSSTKDVDLLRIELERNDEDKFEITGPFGKVSVDHPQGVERKDVMAKLVRIAEKEDVYLVVGKAAATVLGRTSGMDCKVGGDMNEPERAFHSFFFTIMKPGIRDVLMNSNHPAKTWFEKAQEESKKGHHQEAADYMHRCQMELYDEERKIKAAFDFFDRNRSGTLSIAELSAATQQLGLPSEDAEVEKLRQEVDVDKSGEITFAEFECWVIKKGGILKLYQRQQAALQKAGASEDACMSCALRETGITEASLSFWSPTLPISEKVAVVELIPDQRAAVAHTRSISQFYHRQALPKLIARAEEMGYSEKDIYTTLDYLREDAPLIVHLNLDRKIGDDLLIDKLANDTHYRNQFETGASGGHLGADTRRRWEHDLFGDAYDKTEGFHRCKYGVLNTTSDPRGVKCCRQYGDSYVVLQDVRFRTTFSARDSGGLKADRLACCDFYAHVLNEYNPGELDVTLQVGCGHDLFLDSDSIDEYKEAQFHGEIALKRHVVRLVAAERHKKEENVKAKIEACSKHHGLELKWMDELEEEQKKAREKQRQDRENEPGRLKFVEVRSSESWKAAATALQSAMINEKVLSGQLKCVDAHCNPGNVAILTAFWNPDAEPLTGVPVDLKFSFQQDAEELVLEWPDLYKWACTECEQVDSGHFVSVTGCYGFDKSRKDKNDHACFVFWDANGKTGTPKMQLKWEQFVEDESKSWVSVAKVLQEKVGASTSMGKLVGIDAHSDGPKKPNFVVFFDAAATSSEEKVELHSLAFRSQKGNYSWNQFYSRAVGQVLKKQPVSITSCHTPGNSSVTFAWFLPKLSSERSEEMERKRSAQETGDETEAKRPRPDEIAMVI